MSVTIQELLEAIDRLSEAEHMRKTTVDGEQEFCDAMIELKGLAQFAKAPSTDDTIETISEKELNRSYQVGISAGLEQAAEHVWKLALEAYRHSDSFSDRLREVAKTLENMSENEHPGVFIRPS